MQAAPPDVGAVSREPLDPMGDAASSEAAGKPATSMMAPWPESTTPNAASADLNEPADKDAGPPAISPSPLDSPPAAAASQNTAISTPAAEPTVNPSQDISTVSGPHRVEIEAQGGVQVGRPRPFLWQPPLDAEDGPSTSSAPSTVFSRPERDDSFAEARNACDSILFCMDDADPSYSNIEVKPVEGQGVVLFSSHGGVALAAATESACMPYDGLCDLCPWIGELKGSGELCCCGKLLADT
jgi:hypothetical protein